VARAGQIVASGGEGWARAPWEKKDPGAPMTAESKMHLASICKSITSIALMNLWEKKRFSLDEPVWPYLRQVFPDVTPAPGVEKITLRNLMNHKSGMIAWEKAGAGVEEKVRNLLSSPLDWEPGSKARYSNGNDLFARIVLQQMAGQDYLSYVREWVFQPIGAGEIDNKPAAVAPTLYYKAGAEKLPGVLFVREDTGISGRIGWFGLYGSALDLAKMLAGLRGDRILSPATTRKMLEEKLFWSPYQGLRGTYYDKNGGLALAGGRGFSGAIMRLGDETDAALLCNAKDIPTVRLIIQAFESQERYASLPRPAETKPSDK
ncbi:MAG: serine hydrolase, partial [Candidatus Sumerlaeota bacterium]|nr:serine hydrolase [Candidatus Sumerlaeota bacterium]